MLLRNYDNIEALIKMPLAQTSGGGTSVRDPYVKGENFGDGYLSFKDTTGNILTSQYYDSADIHLFSFADGGNNLSGYTDRSSLICGYIESEVITYDDYTIENVNSALTYVTHSSDTPQINDNNEVTSNYYKTFYNSSQNDITINCIGVTYRNEYLSGAILIYKKEIPEVTIPAGGNIKLTFTTKVSLGQNKPADYVATASVE